MSSKCRGIGFSICHRLLVQLAHKSPPDARPQPAISRYVPVDEELADLEQDCSGCDGITVIMACRSLAKGESARTELLRLLDEDIAEIKKDEKNDGWADKFRANVQVDVARLDLAEMKSVFKFADIINSKCALNLFIPTILVMADYCQDTHTYLIWCAMQESRHFAVTTGSV